MELTLNLNGTVVRWKIKDVLVIMAVISDLESKGKIEMKLGMYNK